jgi:hypothetical protein
MQARSEDILTIFDVCLERMRCGDSPEACLLDYPSEAEELGPLLYAAMRARTFQPPPLNPEARAAIQRRLRQAIAVRQPKRRRLMAGWFRPMAVRFALALFIALLSIRGGVAAAQTSLPGSLLYPAKRAGESIRLGLALSPAARAALHLDFAASRAAEVIALANRQQVIDNRLVADLEREYNLAREEFARAPSTEASHLIIRYVAARRADVAMLSAALVHADSLAQPQLERALRLSEQALVGISPAETPAPSAPSPAFQPAPARDANRVSTPGANQSQGDPPTPVGIGEHSGVGQNVELSEQGNSTDPQPTPSSKPADPGPEQRPETPPGQDNSTPAEPGPEQRPEVPPGQDNGTPAEPGPEQRPETPPGQDNGTPAEPGPEQRPETPPGQDNGTPAEPGPEQRPETPPGQDNGTPAEPGPEQRPETPPGQDNGTPAEPGPEQRPETPPGQGNGNNSGNGGHP